MTHRFGGWIRHLVVTLSTISLALMAPAQAGAILPTVAVYGGMSFPREFGSNSWGLRGNLFLSLAPFLSFGPEVGVYDFKGGELDPACITCADRTQTRVTTYAGALRLGPPLPILHPYLIAGLGAYSWKGEHIADRTQLGMNAGLGLDYGPTLSPIKFSLEGRWHSKAGSSGGLHGERSFTTAMVGLRLSIL